ncbi:MAG: hypothetical protein ACTSRA_12180, partial [Promethearchaeota archaeon]
MKRNLEVKSNQSDVARVKKFGINDVGRLTLAIWAFYYFLPQFLSIILLQVHDVVFAYLAFYWLVNGFLFGITMIIIWRYTHPLSQIGFFPVFAASGYGTTRYLVEEIWYLSPGIFLVHCLIAGLLIFNFILMLVNMIKNIQSLEFINRLKYLHKNRKFQVILLASCAWFGMTSWSYFGFSQGYTVSDPHQENFRISFWGSPSGGTNISFYSSPEGIAEMEIYSALNASFYNTIGLRTINNTAYMSQVAQMLKEWEKFNVSIIYDITPYYWNGDDYVGDFVSYNYLEEINETVRALMDWIEPLKLSNFRGISFDVERPKNDSWTISREQY